MAKNKEPLDSEPLDYDYNLDISDITKESIAYEVRKFVIEPYIEKFDGTAVVDIKVPEFLKAQEMVMKLLGLDDDGGEEFPDEVKLFLP